MKIGLCGLLTLLFAAGKVFGFIDWSWWWVLSPWWISLSLVLGFMFFVLVVAAWYGQGVAALDGFLNGLSSKKGDDK